ncbi:MAG: ATP-dependent sacrificial sulfur transferase LarE [Phycisphaerae bacterium]|nr:ATP-dependent sacrificial sulfur transferase LarE [Phycisphaerae bacterium]
MIDIDSQLDEKLQRARTNLTELGKAAVAFSGGVDSSCLLKLALDTLGRDNVVAISAVGPVFPAYQQEQARRIASGLHARHLELLVEVQRLPEFVRNTPQRCYHCKTFLMTRIRNLAREQGFEHVLAAENADDALDYRPGHRALQELGVHTPLKDAQISKAEIRVLSRQWGLPNWAEPPSPCLASRVAYGQTITTELLQQIDQAEAFLRAEGFEPVRVRVHGPVARLELAAGQIARAAELPMREKIEEKLRELGFAFTAVDLAGYRYGNLNRLLPQTAEPQ